MKVFVDSNDNFTLECPMRTIKKLFTQCKSNESGPD